MTTYTNLYSYRNISTQHGGAHTKKERKLQRTPYILENLP